MALFSDLPSYLLPLLVATVCLFALRRRVDVFGSFLEGAEEGLKLLLAITPYVVAIFVAIGLVRESGALEVVSLPLRPLLLPLGIPPEIIPLALTRPLSGSGSLALAAELIARWGPDSYIGRLASVVQSSTDTTLYILAVYFGAVGVTRIRHALWAGLIADLAGFLASVALVKAFF